MTKKKTNSKYKKGCNVVELFNLYHNNNDDFDLKKIKLVVSKEDDTIMTGKEFNNNLDPKEIPTNKILRYDIFDERFILDCIDMQWYVFV
jgi:hypothetical protein